MVLEMRSLAIAVKAMSGDAVRVDASPAANQITPSVTYSKVVNIRPAGNFFFSWRQRRLRAWPRSRCAGPPRRPATWRRRRDSAATPARTSSGEPIAVSESRKRSEMPRFAASTSPASMPRVEGRDVLAEARALDHGAIEGQAPVGDEIVAHRLVRGGAVVGRRRRAPRPRCRTRPCSCRPARGRRAPRASRRRGCSPGCTATASRRRRPRPRAAACSATARRRRSAGRRAARSP